MGKQLFFIENPTLGASLEISQHEQGRKSMQINGTWGGCVDQFKDPKTTIEDVKKKAVEWLSEKITENRDAQFNSQKSYTWLKMQLVQRNLFNG